jgi:hypothetical protein
MGGVTSLLMSSLGFGVVVVLVVTFQVGRRWAGAWLGCLPDVSFEMACPPLEGSMVRLGRLLLCEILQGATIQMMQCKVCRTQDRAFGQKVLGARGVRASTNNIDRLFPFEIAVLLPNTTPVSTPHIFLPTRLDSLLLSLLRSLCLRWSPLTRPLVH